MRKYPKGFQHTFRPPSTSNIKINTIKYGIMIVIMRPSGLKSGGTQWGGAGKFGVY